MIPTEKELKTIAYMRAYKENKTAWKSFILGIVLFALVVVDVVLIAEEYLNPAGGIGIFMALMIGMSVGNYFIRRKENTIAKRILGE